ncbi:MAG: hypothetical protein WBC69_15755 [Geitlerinemataceae cyanobacterium]
MAWHRPFYFELDLLGLPENFCRSGFAAIDPLCEWLCDTPTESRYEQPIGNPDCIS